MKNVGSQRVEDFGDAGPKAEEQNRRTDEIIAFLEEHTNAD